MKERTKRILRQAGRRMSALVILFAMALTAAANLPTEVWAANGEMTGGWTFNEHYYRIYDKGLDWYAAKEYCENVGGHLVTITSQDEQNVLRTMLSQHQGKNFWMGGLKDDSGKMRWITGEDFSYTNWSSSQPDHSSETALMIYTYDNPNVSGNDAYKWNDLAPDGTYQSESWFGLENFGFICEWDFINVNDGKVRFNGHDYKKYEEEMDWSAAKAYCETIGGHLVTITSQKEQEFLEYLTSDGAREGYWIGGTDEETEGDYRWITGEPFDYTNWRYDQPDNMLDGDAVHGEDYLHLWTESKWNDNTNDGSNVSIGFICEWGEDDGMAVSSVEIVTYPYTLMYDLINSRGEKVDTTGLKLRVTYADGSTKEITGGFTVSPSVITQSDRNVITVTYRGKSDTYHVLADDSKKQFIDAHLDFIQNGDYTRYMNASLQSDVIGQKDMEDVKKVNDFWNIFALNWFDNPYDVVLSDFILSQNTQDAIEQVYDEEMDDAGYEVVKDLIALINKEGILGDNNNYSDVKFKIEEMFEKDDFSDEETFQLVGKTLKEADQETLSKAFSFLKKYSLVVDTAGDVSEVVQNFAKLRYQYAVLRGYTASSEYLKEMLKDIKTQCDQGKIDGASFDAKKMSKAINRYLTLTEENMTTRVSTLALKNYGKCAWNLLGDKLIVDNVKVFLRKGLSAKLSEAALSTVNNAILGIKIGYTVCKILVNGSFNMDQKASTFSLYYTAAGMTVYMKSVVENAKERFLNNPTYENAVLFCEYWQIYQQSQVGIAEYGIQYYTAKGSAFIVRHLGLDNCLAESSLLLLSKRNWLSYTCHRTNAVVQTVSQSKLITVACPVNVTITDAKGGSVLQIQNDVIVKQSDAAQAVVIDGVKYIALGGDQNYKVNITATAGGRMDYYVTDVDSGMNVKSTTAYSNIPLTKNAQYAGQLAQSPQDTKTAYALSQGGSTVKSESSVFTADTFVEIKTITVNQKQLTMQPGGTAKLSAVMAPSNAASKTVSWHSSDTDVVTVDEYGNVKAVKGGTAEIVCYSVFGKAFASVPVTVNKSVSSVSIKKLPTKQVYTVGEVFNQSGMILKVTYNDGTAEEITKGFSYSPSTLATVGQQKIIVNYQGKTTGFYVTVNKAKTVAGVTIAKKPAKLTYTVGETFSSAGMKLKITYADNTTSEITGGFTCTPSGKLNTAGQQKIVVSYGGKSTGFYVAVKSVTSVTIAKKPTKQTYSVGETFSSAGMKLNITYADNTTSEITSGFTCTPSGKLNTAGQQKIVVSYGGKSTGFYVTVRNDFEIYNGILLKYNGTDPHVVIPSTVKVIGTDAFRSRTDIETVSIPDSVTSIGNAAFYLCSGLTGKLTIPDSVTSIGSYAFSGCKNLTEIRIPHSVTSIRRYAFMGCTGLKSINLPASITSIEDSLFESCESLKGHMTIPASVTSIGNSSFRGCYSLTGVTIPRSVTSIGVNAFGDCRSLTSITIPASVTSISIYAFSSCYNLTSVVIPDSVTSIEEGAFESCLSLKGVIVPDSVTSIGKRAFDFCLRLTSVTLPKAMTSIEDSTFWNCDSLTEITIPDSVQSIGEYAFEGCDNLMSITIPQSVSSIGKKAFGSCPSLQNVYYTGSQSQWNALKTNGINATGNSYLVNAGQIVCGFNPKTVTSVAVKAKPVKTVYSVGETFSPVGLKLTVTYSNGITKEVTSGITCTPSGAFTKTGQQKIVVSYGGKSTGFYVTVVKAVSSLTVKKLPAKKTYSVGETFSSEGMILKVIYTDGSTEEVSVGFFCTPAVMIRSSSLSDGTRSETIGFLCTPTGKFTSSGQQKIVVTYGGKSTGFNVTVA